MSRIEVQGPQSDFKEGQRLMVTKLRKYNEIRGLPIVIGTIGSHRHICYWDGGWRVSVTTVAVHMGKKETGMQTGHWGAYNWSLSWE